MTAGGDTRAIIVTGADQAFSRALAQLLLSARRKGDDARYRWIVYDLGIDADRLAALRARFDWCDWRRVPFEDLPGFYAPRTRSFAWKPWAIWQVLADAQAPVLWMDSATIIRGDLQEVFDFVRAHGFYVALGQAAIRDRCEPAVMDRLGFARDLADMREGVANFIGFDPQHAVARGVARDWEMHARDADLLLPAKRTIARHMNDQAVLNCLVMPLVAAGRLRLPNVDTDISAGRPFRVVSTRNKLAPNVPLWADPLVRARYWLEKAADQALWRLKDWWRGEK